MKTTLATVAAAGLWLAAALASAADAPPGNPPSQSTTPPPGRPMGPGAMGQGGMGQRGMGPGGMAGMQGSQQMHGMMMQHMMGLQQMQMSGNVDRDFAEMMIRHHEGAIAMAKVQIEQGKDDGLKKQARKIVSDSEKDIAALKAALAKMK